jgi:hypothetical protein
VQGNIEKSIKKLAPGRGKIYRKKIQQQREFEDFYLPFGRKLRSDNRWVRLTKLIPGMVGKNIGVRLENNNLPRTVSVYGNTPEEIFINYEDVISIIGKEEINNIPLGAIGIYSYCNKLRVGLQQLMAGARCFNLASITRDELMSLTEECARVTKIPYIMESQREEAIEILTG